MSVVVSYIHSMLSSDFYNVFKIKIIVKINPGKIQVILRNGFLRTGLNNFLIAVMMGTGTIVKDRHGLG